MAVAELNVSRREVLAAALATPVACAAPPRRQGPSHSQQRKLDSGSSPENSKAGQQQAQSFVVTKWDRALARFRHAEAALAAAAHEPDEEAYGDILCAFNAALKLLLRAPAADVAALALKLELAAREAAWELTGAETCIAALAREARALSLPIPPDRWTEAPSPILLDTNRISPASLGQCRVELPFLSHLLA